MAATSERDGGGQDCFLLMSYLDEVQDRVEDLRRKALSLQQDKSSLLTILSQLKDDRLQYSLTGDESYEIITKIEQLRERCENVDISIQTSRTPEQESSYLLVNSLVTKLENMSLLGSTDSTGFIHQAQGYLNACISDGVFQGPIDYKFQGMILDCKLEDQKLVRHRLECLVKGTFPTDLPQQTSQLHNGCTSLSEEEEQGQQAQGERTKPAEIPPLGAGAYGNS